MGSSAGFDWGDLRRLAGPLLQAVLTAVLVALLVLLGYPISPIYPVAPQESELPLVSVMGVSHFGSITLSEDLIVGDDLTVLDATLFTGNGQVGGTFIVTGASTLTGAAGLSSTLDVAGVSTLAGPVDATGALTVTGVTTLASSASVGGYLALGEQTYISMTAGLSITPTSSYIGLRSGAAVTTSTSTAITDGAYVGQILILVNENASDAITIDDGGNTQLSGDAVLGEGDTLMVIWDGTDWLEVAQANNT